MNVMEKFQLQNAVAVVTGGARGLGKAMATAFVQAGAHIVIADKDIADFATGGVFVIDGGYSVI